MNTDDVRAAVQVALHREGLDPMEARLPQKPMKRVAVRLADELVGAMRLASNPTLWTNRVRDVKRKGWLRHTRATVCAENMVDVFVCAGNDDPYKTILTIECEASEKHSATTPTSDYYWDLYKLLQVPSPLRIVIVRHARKRHDDLAAGVARLVEAYEGLYRVGDRIFSVLVPTARFDPRTLTVHGWKRHARGLARM